MRKSSVVDELLPFDHHNINEFCSFNVITCNQMMELYKTYRYDISGYTMVMHINVCHNGGQIYRSYCPSIA